MDEQKPDAVWIFPEEPSKRGPRVALVILLLVLVLIAAIVVALFLIPRDRSAPTPPPGPSASPSVSTPPSAPATMPPSSAPGPTNAPTPPVPPEMASFRDEVSPRLDAMTTTLSTMRASDGPSSTGTVDSLRGSLQRISDLGAPDQIRSAWGSLLLQLDTDLQHTQSALASGTDPTSDVDAAIGTIKRLQQLLGS